MYGVMDTRFGCMRDADYFGSITVVVSFLLLQSTTNNTSALSVLFNLLSLSASIVRVYSVVIRVLSWTHVLSLSAMLIGY